MFALQFFDAEFTTQQLSPSVLEDTLNSQGGTPMRSGTVSRDEGGEWRGSVVVVVVVVGVNERVRMRCERDKIECQSGSLIVLDELH